MEHTFTIDITCSTVRRQQLEDLVQTFDAFDLDQSMTAARAMGGNLHESMAALYDEYGDYLNCLETEEKKTFKLRGMGSYGTDAFVVKLLPLLAPYVDALNATLWHDESDDALKLTMVGGVVYADGHPYVAY